MKLNIAKQPILNELQNLSRKHWNLLKKYADIEKNLCDIEEKINSLQDAYKTLFGEQPPTEILPPINTNLGDALEFLLREKKSLKIEQVIELMRGKRVKLSLKNPRNVLANLVKNDSKKRFTRSDDGRIILREK